MKFIVIAITLGLGLSLHAQSPLTNAQIDQTFMCKVSFGLIGNSKVEEMLITITKADLSGQLPTYPKAKVTLTLSGPSQRVSLPTVDVASVYAQPPFSQFPVSGYSLSWNDKARSDLNLVCQDQTTCTGSGNIQGYPLKVITCKKIPSKR